MTYKMKKNDWILLVTVALYSFLFYKQTAGINFLLFTVLLIAGLLIKDKQLVKNHYWKLVMAGSVLSALCIVYYGNTLAVIANILSLSILSALSYTANTSVVAAVLFSAYSYSSSSVFMMQDWIARKSARMTLQSGGKKWILIFIPLLITIIFFFMYRASNALFNDFTKNINLDFISWSWITFTLGGLILSYGFFYHQKIKSLSELDEHAPNDLHPTSVKSVTLFGKVISVNDEEFSSMLLFILLNMLLLIVNALDANFIFHNRSLPEGITYSQFVHQNTDMLIASILTAIAIILFYFRGAINFSAKSKTIKLLAYAWIIQNAFILLSTIFKNNMYVLEFGLTYKRIGVYMYLTLTFIGLVTTFIKIMHKKTNAYLFRVNGWLFYGVLIIMAFINWDGLITEFNFHKVKRVDPDYLLNLSNAPFPALYAFQCDSIKKQNSATVEEQPRVDNLWKYEAGNFDRNKDQQLYAFLKSRQALSWRSWNYSSEKIYNELLVLNKEQKIQRLNLYEMGITSLQALKNFGNITELNLRSNKLNSLQELFFFPGLKRLDIQGNNLKCLRGIEALKDLEYLSIGQNPITDYRPVYSLKKLKKLWVGNQLTVEQYAMLQKFLPNTSILKK
jgi:hypothetical protein